MLRLGAELLAVQPQVIGVAEHLLEEEPRLLQVAHTGEALDVPEGAHRERALLAGEPVGESTGEAIAVDQGVTHQLVLDRAQRRDPARVGRGYETDQWYEERRRVDGGGADMLDVRPSPSVHETGEQFVAYQVTILSSLRACSSERKLG